MMIGKIEFDCTKYTIYPKFCNNDRNWQIIFMFNPKCILDS